MPKQHFESKGWKLNAVKDLWQFSSEGSSKNKDSLASCDLAQEILPERCIIAFLMDQHFRVWNYMCSNCCPGNCFYMRKMKNKLLQKSSSFLEYLIWSLPQKSCRLDNVWVILSLKSPTFSEMWRIAKSLQDGLAPKDFSGQQGCSPVTLVPQRISDDMTIRNFLQPYLLTCENQEHDSGVQDEFPLFIIVTCPFFSDLFGGFNNNKQALYCQRFFHSKWSIGNF